MGDAGASTLAGKHEHRVSKETRKQSAPMKRLQSQPPFRVFLGCPLRARALEGLDVVRREGAPHVYLRRAGSCRELHSVQVQHDAAGHLHAVPPPLLSDLLPPVLVPDDGQRDVLEVPADLPVAARARPGAYEAAGRILAAPEHLDLRILLYCYTTMLLYYSATIL